MSDKSKPELPWYASGLAFECTQCGNCCSGPASGFVWVDDREIEAMAREMQLGDDLDTFRRRFVRQVGLRQSLVEYADGDCIFLDPDTRRCAVYSSRPSQCRSWPFWDRNLQSPQAWKATAQHCPGCNGGPVHSLDVIESIRSMKKAT
jgi:Fe-S-cluster containining protein